MSLNQKRYQSTLQQQHQRMLRSATLFTTAKNKNTSDAGSSYMVRMFNWSLRSVSVRQFVDDNVTSLPAVVRIAVGNHDPQDRFDFKPNTLYLVRSMFSQLLVIARTSVGRYLTIPLTSSVKFYLLSHRDDQPTESSISYTLADMLSHAIVTSFHGRYVHLASHVTSLDYSISSGVLELTTMYCEKYMLGHMFSGATVSEDVKVIPGYLPVTLHVASGLAGGQLTDFQHYVTQIASCCESTEKISAISSSCLEEIALFDESPTSEYDIVDDTIYSRILPSLKQEQSQATIPGPVNLSGTSFTDQRLTVSNERQHEAYQVPTNNGIRSRPLPPVPRHFAKSPMTRSLMNLSQLTVCDDNISRSFQSKLQKSNDSLHGSVANDFHSNDDDENLYEKYDDDEFSVCRQSVGFKKSLPVASSTTSIHRTGSDPSSFYDELPETIGRRLSQSLESVAHSESSMTSYDDQHTSESADIYDVVTTRQQRQRPLNSTETTSTEDVFPTSQLVAPALPPKPSMNDVIESFRSKRRVSLLRQKPVARARGGLEGYRTLVRGQTLHNERQITDGYRREPRKTLTRGFTVTAASSSSTSSAFCATNAAPVHTQDDDVKPNDVDVGQFFIYDSEKPVTYTDAYEDEPFDGQKLNNEENLYEEISSPVYLDMSQQSHRPSLVTNTSRRPSNAAQAAAVLTSPAVPRQLCDSDDVNEMYMECSPSPKVVERTPAKNPSMYMNSDDLQTSVCDVTPVAIERSYKTDAAFDAHNKAPKTASPAASRSGIVRPILRKSDSGIVPDDVDFPATPSVRQLNSSMETEGECATVQSSTLSTSVANQSTTLTSDSKWSSVDEIPADVTTLSVDDVTECLRLLNLSQYVSAFRQQQIDGELLSCLTRDVLLSDFAFKQFDAIKLDKFVRQGWRPKLTSQQSQLQQSPQQSVFSLLPSICEQQQNSESDC